MEWLTVAEVATELQLTRTTVPAMIRRGDLLARKQPGAKSHPWMVPRLALEALLDRERDATRRFVKENPPGFSARWDRETGSGPR